MEKSIGKFTESMKSWGKIVSAMIAEGKNLSELVSISEGNNKMGKIASVSLLPLLTCPARCKGTCDEKCYAKKLCVLRPTVLNSYAKNTAIQKHAMKAYFHAIDNAVKNARFFRFHVSGDIPTDKYFRYMVETAINNPSTTFLCFTKQYEIINKWIAKNGELPQNLRVLFSEWKNLEAINPYNLPTTNVYNDESEIKADWKLCGGNCLNCAIKGSHCWNANKGETIAFKIH